MTPFAPTPQPESRRQRAARPRVVEQDIEWRKCAPETAAIATAAALRFTTFSSVDVDLTGGPRAFVRVFGKAGDTNGAGRRLCATRCSMM